MVRMFAPGSSLSLRSTVATRHPSLRTGRPLLRGIVTAAAAKPLPTEQFTPTPERLPVQQLSRREAIKNSKPFSAFLTDNFDREHDYLRISITEKCNLRCLYCMPEEGVPQSPHNELLTSPEIFMLSSLFVQQGVKKIRLTGGEPTVRRDIVPLMQQIGSLRKDGLRELCITTNGVALHRKLDGMVEAGLTGVNLSLDTLDPFQFQVMTRRNGFEMVKKSIERILEMNKLGAGIKLKINCVVMRGLNEKEIIPFVELGKDQDLEVRFIEYMPFDGNKWSQGKMLSYTEMLEMISRKYPSLRKVQDAKNDTSKTYEVPGFAGRMGFITSMTHNFCGSCNRLRITSDGNLKVCLFGNAEVSLRDVLRRRNNGHPIDEKAFEALQELETRGKQGPLGTSPEEQELLEVIGMAVKRKKAKHAGMGVLENMKNRPMILIADALGRSKSPLSMTTSWQRVPTHLLSPVPLSQARFYSSKPSSKPSPALTHINATGSAHMVSISDKASTKRTAVAVCSVHFSNEVAAALIRANSMKKGDVLSVARIAGIMASKRTPDLVPLCHPVSISHVSVDLDVVGGEPASEAASGESSLSEAPPATGHDDFGRVDITATVSCTGQTGVEMEAMTAASVAALTVYDMCKAVDKKMRVEGLRVIRKEGGKSGTWIAP